MTVRRRDQVERLTGPERAIREAVHSVEVFGAHPLLTEAVLLLGKAREKVADFIDRPPSSRATEWLKDCTIGWKSDQEYWVRWTSRHGLYFWLHPTTGEWVGEPDQINMPTFNSGREAHNALMDGALAGKAPVVEP